METQNTPDSQNNPEEEKWSWRESGSLTSDCTTNLELSRQHDTGRAQNGKY